MRAILALLAGCTSTWSVRDEDGDGVSLAQGDCNDKPGVGAQQSPLAEEVWYDGIDQNCDGADDYDQDGDGARSAAHGGDDCWDDPTSIPADMTALNGLPQLDAADVHPGAADAWYDGIDQDCDASNDFDQDGDGFDSAWYTSRLGEGNDCYDAVDDPFENGSGAAPEDVNPAATDSWYDGTDQDCGGEDDYDQDGDGFPISEECDDEDPAVYPNPDIEEVWYNGLDENCDGNDGDQDGDGFLVEGYVEADPPIHFRYAEGDCWDDPSSVPVGYDPINGFPALDSDEVFPTAVETWYDGIDQDCGGDDDFDQDADGFESDAWPDRAGAVGEDCDDEEGTTYPGAVETWYDGVDADCDTWSDFDQDRDGFDSDDYGGEDCDDGRALTNPGVNEECGTAQDDDCSGATDDRDANDCETFFYDGDGDTYGTTSSQCWCNPQTATNYDAENDDDCNDSQAGANPGVAREDCSTTFDDDCDGALEEQNATNCSTFYLDSDGDSYGSTSSQCWCEAQTGTNYDATVGTDCDDTRSSVNPGATEICDSSNRDEDCDGTADNDDSSASSTGKTRYYPDDDGDEYGDSSDAGTLYCDDPSTASVEWATTATDCNDANAAINPGATEICDATDTDEDCDGTADDSDSSTSSSTKVNYYTDADADGYGTGTASLRCNQPSGTATNATDCDDTRSSVNPGATEVCDSFNRDEDCDGVADDSDSSTSSSSKSNYYVDADLDTYGAGTAVLRCDSASGYSTNATDCDDTRSSVNPGATEVCDSSNRDEDCDGTADDSDTSTSNSSKTSYYLDADSDAYGTGTALLRCETPSGYATVDGDCDDADATVNPGETDPTDGTLLDEDCDGIADDDGLAAGDLVFTEFFVAGSVASNDWVEVYNASGVDLDLEGWELTLCYVSDSSLPLPVDGADCDATDVITISGSLVVPDGGYAVFCNSASLFTPAACDYDYNYTNITSSGGIASSIGGFAVAIPAAAIDSFYWWNTTGSNDWSTGSNSKSIQLDAGVESSASAATTNDDYSTNDSDDDIWCQYPGSNSYSSTGLLGTPATANAACP